MIQKIRVTKEFSFEMSHVLSDYDGPCRNIHGHSYRLFVTVAGTPLNDPGNPKNGMVIDFNELKQIVNDEIINIFDHSVAVCSDYVKTKLDTLKSIFSNIVTIDYQPTCENLAADFAQRIKNRIPGNIKLHSIKLFETATSFAEWFSSDNE